MLGHLVNYQEFPFALVVSAVLCTQQLTVCACGRGRSSVKGRVMGVPFEGNQRFHVITREPYFLWVGSDDRGV